MIKLKRLICKLWFGHRWFVPEGILPRIMIKKGCLRCGLLIKNEEEGRGKGDTISISRAPTANDLQRKLLESQVNKSTQAKSL